jgi:hypothetical protein
VVLVQKVQATAALELDPNHSVVQYAQTDFNDSLTSLFDALVVTQLQDMYT